MDNEDLSSAQGVYYLRIKTKQKDHILKVILMR